MIDKRSGELVIESISLHIGARLTRAGFLSQSENLVAL